MAKAQKQKKRSWIVWFIPLGVILVLSWFAMSMFSPTVIDTSEGLDLLKGTTVKRAVVNDGTQQVVLDLSKAYAPKVRPESGSFSAPQASKKVTFTFTRAQAEKIDKLLADGKLEDGYNSVYPTSSWWETVLQMIILVSIFSFVLYFMTSKMQGGPKFMNFGKSKARSGDEAPSVRFDDVAGEDEAVEELQEIKEFLEIPQKFHALGAKIPKGVLLYGPPGTGKTLLAKAVAGEAGVPFYSMSGSEFVEMFVGVGASRVRDLFDQAKEHAPSIIFVDEIDAVGRNRGSGIGGGNDEREQTLNQLLVEMDGFDENQNVIVMAATNRPDVLDPALLRPGRFDRQIAVEAPDLKGREAILKVHAKGKPLTKDVDLASVAKRTPGFTGADLANVLNEAALLTARSNADLIDIRALDEAIDRVIAGPQKRTRVMNNHDKAVTAYHEGGHALCAAALNYTDPVTKVTILPRGRALGYTMVMPTEDRFNKTRNQLLDELVYAMGGRVAEELVFLDPSTGASNDIEKATKTARKLVADYGMSSQLGPVKLGSEDTQPFMGKDGYASRDFSDSTADIIDREVRQLLDTAIREAWEILSRNRHVLDRLAQELIEKETLLEKELDAIFTDVIKQPKRQQWSYGADAAVDPAAFGNPIVESTKEQGKPADQQPDDNTPASATETVEPAETVAPVETVEPVEAVSPAETIAPAETVEPAAPAPVTTPVEAAEPVPAQAPEVTPAVAQEATPVSAPAAKAEPADVLPDTTVPADNAAHTAAGDADTAQRQDTAELNDAAQQQDTVAADDTAHTTKNTVPETPATSTDSQEMSQENTQEQPETPVAADNQETDKKPQPTVPAQAGNTVADLLPEPQMPLSPRPALSVHDLPPVTPAPAQTHEPEPATGTNFVVPPAPVVRNRTSEETPYKDTNLADASFNNQAFLFGLGNNATIVTDQGEPTPSEEESDNNDADPNRGIWDSKDL